MSLKYHYNKEIYIYTDTHEPKNMYQNLYMYIPCFRCRHLYAKTRVQRSAHMSLSQKRVPVHLEMNMEAYTCILISEFIFAKHFYGHSEGK